MGKNQEELAGQKERMISQGTNLSLKMEPDTIMQDGDLLSDALNAQVLYLCDRRKCERCGSKSNGQCQHTRDITHAENFENIQGKFFEKRKEEIENPGQ